MPAHGELRRRLADIDGADNALHLRRDADRLAVGAGRADRDGGAVRPGHAVVAATIPSEALTAGLPGPPASRSIATPLAACERVAASLAGRRNSPVQGGGERATVAPPVRGAYSMAMLNSLDIEGRPHDTRVVVAMSGGVDSSVTAALLKAEGYDVVGVTLQLYDHGAATHRKGACCAGQDIHDARAVAERIGIPHYVLDYESRFKEAVIDRFAESYVAGETPVPCVDCNQAIKFTRPARHRARARRRGAGDRPLRRLARAAGRRPRALSRAARRSATRAISCSPPRARSSTCCAFRSATCTKARDARARARSFGLAVADKHDSQDICFVPTGRYTDVIERLKPGAAAAGDDRRPRRPGARPPRRHHPFHRRPAARPRSIAAGAPLYVVRARCRNRAASWSARARR